MAKRFRAFFCVLLTASLLLSAASAGEALTFSEAFGLAGQGIQMDLQEISLLPEDYSGFEIRVCADLADMVSALIILEPVYGEDGMCSLALPEEIASELLANAEPLSLGPDGAILYFIRLNTGGLLFVRRDKALTPLLQATDRGAPDKLGNLKGILSDKLNVQPNVVNGDVRWSPDGRYLFMNEPYRWIRNQYRMDDPYLTDTITGEIFLLETSPNKPLAQGGDQYRFIISGGFSGDGRYFDYLLRTHNEESAVCSALMRWDLETGTAETVYESEDSLFDFCEMGENRWLLLGNGKDYGRFMLRLSRTDTGVSAEPENIPGSSNLWLYPVSDGLVFVADQFGPGISTFLLPVRWESTGPWMIVRDLSSGTPAFLTAEEVNAVEKEIAEVRYGALYTTMVISASWPEVGYIPEICVIDGTPLVLMPVNIALSVPSGWPDRLQYAAGLVLLDTETMQCRTVFRSIWQGVLPGSDRDLTLYDSCLLKSGSAVSLTEAGPESGDALPADDGDYTSPWGDYEYRRAGDNIALRPYQNRFGFVSLKYTNLNTTVTASGNGYVIQSVFTRFPEPVPTIYRVPEAITEEHFNVLLSSMSPKSKKKITPCYTKVGPDNLDRFDNAEALLAAYPSLSTETLYILRDDLRQNNLRVLEAELFNIGYTQEDFDLDSANAVSPRGTNTCVLIDPDLPKADDFISCSFPGAASDASLTLSRVLQLGGLCDQVNSAVYLQHLRPEGEPTPLASVIPETVELEGTLWHITLDSAKDTGDQVKLTLTAVPEN